MADSRKKPHTSPTAQYTLVNIRGKNSIASDDPTIIGNIVTNICSRRKPMMYALSRSAITTKGSELGYS